ncbi:hypothetical protein GE09DRAFT_193041 [Coniochaeta sp. 2T2.1]|nr:hypothetical protein GE09DRAFT_193041 [Coniochaeta sp. 2T2.1]
MPEYSQYDDDDDTRFDVVLYEEDPDGRPDAVELKSDFEVRPGGLGGEEQPLRPIDEDVGDNTLTVQCDMAQVIHGTMTKGGSPATLVVFQFVFLPRSNSRRFKNATIIIEFDGGCNVEKITPHNSWAMLKSKKEQKISHSISPSLEAAFGPGKASMGYTWQLEESIELEGFARIEGMTRSLGQSASFGEKRINTVMWTLRENNTKQVKSGIPSFVQAAVLLRRERTSEPLGAKFGTDIVIRGEVDNREWAKDRWKEAVKGMAGKRHKGENVIFNPALNRGSVEDVHNLDSVDMESYKQLITIRQWSDGAGETPMEELKAPELGIAGISSNKTAPVQGTATSRDDGKEKKQLSQPAAERHIPTVKISGTESREAARPRYDIREQASPTSVTIEHIEDRHLSMVQERTEVEVTKSGTDVQNQDWTLADLQEQLSLVRHEARLVNRLVALANEERRLLAEIRARRGTA